MNHLTAGLRACFAALLATAVAVVLRQVVMVPFLGLEAPFIPFLFAVAAAAWAGGVKSGMLATLLGAMVGSYLFLEQTELQALSGMYQLRLVVFLIVGGLTTWLVDSAHFARRDIGDQRRQLEHEALERQHAETAEREQRDRLAAEMRRREGVEVALCEQEERIRLALEFAEIGTWDLLPGTAEITSSRLCKAAFGFPPDANVSYAQYLERIHPEDRDSMNQAVKAAVNPQGSGAYELDYRVLWPDGTIRWILAKGQALFEGDGANRRASRFIGTVADITQRKQVEIALRKAEEKFRALATHAPVGIFQTDSQGRCLFVNQTWCEIAGAQLEDALGDGWRHFVHPEDQRRVVDEWQAATLHRRNHVTEFRFLNQKTGVRSVLASATALLDSAGLVNGYVGTIVDLTERKAAEDIVRASEARLKGFLDNSTAVIYLKDLEGRYVLVNRQWEKLFGHQQRQIVGHKPSQLFPEQTVEQFRANDRIVIQTGQPIVVEETVPHADGLHVYITVKFPIKSAEGLIVAVGGISTDITDRKMALEALEAEQELLRHTIEVQDRERQLISYEIHDGLVQYATGALMQLQAMREQAQSAAVARQIENLVALLQKTIAEGRRLVNGIRTPVLDDWGIVAAVEQLIGDEERAHVQIEFVKDESLGRMAHSVEEALYRITQEAMTNIRKHSQSCNVRVELGKRGDRVHLEVRDWGVGFTPVGRAKNVHGLKGMSERARIAGGRCTIESAPGEGTQVVVDLPYLDRN